MLCVQAVVGTPRATSIRTAAVVHAADCVLDDEGELKMQTLLFYAACIATVATPEIRWQHLGLPASAALLSRS